MLHWRSMEEDSLSYGTAPVHHLAEIKAGLYISLVFVPCPAGTTIWYLGLARVTGKSWECKGAQVQLERPGKRTFQFGRSSQQVHSDSACFCSLKIRASRHCGMCIHQVLKCCKNASRDMSSRHENPGWANH